ncbi:MAG: ribosomal methyltransferase [bacterium]|nr:ribosomal methyltransferase [bacterium]
MQDRLLPPAPASLLQGLEGLAAALEVVQPLRARHRAQLPGEVARLSEWLTTARDELPRDYLSRPALLSAYLYYFLPWNLFRQGRLLAGLDLQLAAGARIVDVGAGPFTFALALWLTRPDLRSVPLNYLALDRAAAALGAGRRLWEQVAAGSVWKVDGSAQPAGARALPPADLLVLANVLNEVHKPGGGDREVDTDAAARLLERWGQSLAPGGRVLVIEPGTRPASRQLVMLRGRALELGWRVAAPCPHAERCPQSGIGRQPWCHFAFETARVPGWLEDLSRRADLAKERASLSFLLLEPGSPGAAPESGTSAGAGDDMPVRVVSGTFALPAGERGRYGCSARGLVLLVDRNDGTTAGPQSGDLVRVSWPADPPRDAKSGAAILRSGRLSSGTVRRARRTTRP